MEAKSRREAEEARIQVEKEKRAQIEKEEREAKARQEGRRGTGEGTPSHDQRTVDVSQCGVSAVVGVGVGGARLVVGVFFHA